MNCYVACAPRDDGGYLIFASFLQRSLDGQQRFLECRQIVFHRIPDDLAVDPLILVAQDIADTGDVPSGHPCAATSAHGQDACSLPRSPRFPAPAPTAKPRSARSRARFCRRWLFRFPGCSQACRGCGAEGTGSPLKNPGGLGFNPLANKRVQSLARRQVDVNAQALLQQTLAGDQVKRVELAAGIIVDEQVDVAFGASLVLGGGSKQIKRYRAPRPEGTSETTQLSEGFCSGHGLSYHNHIGSSKANAHAPPDWRSVLNLSLIHISEPTRLGMI